MFSRIYYCKLKLVMVTPGFLSSLRNKLYLVIQWKPLNVITIGQRKTDNINHCIHRRIPGFCKKVCGLVLLQTSLSNIAGLVIVL